jgi:hypothetical protein
MIQLIGISDFSSLPAQDRKPAAMPLLTPIMATHNVSCCLVTKVEDRQSFCATK